MYKIKYLIAFLFLINLNVFSQDDGLPSSGLVPSETKSTTSFKAIPAELKNKMQTFYNDLLDNKIDEAYDKLLLNCPISKKVEDVRALKLNTKRSFELYGVIQGFEPVSIQYVSSSYLRLRYLGLHSKNPMRWIFTYYKSPEQGWIIIDIKYDDLSSFFFEDE